MRHPSKREKRKHTKSPKWWNNFSILGDKAFAKKLTKGKLIRSKGSVFVFIDKIFEGMKKDMK